MSLCIFEGCIIPSRYGKSTDQIPNYCNTHKKPNHIDVTRRICVHDGCNKQPSYGLEGTTFPISCSLHKLSSYVDVIHRTCRECDKIPIFGISGTTKAIYCADHKTDECVNVKNKRCKAKDCLIEPTYGEKGTKNAIYCKSHKPPDYVNVKSGLCISVGCKKRPSYGEIGTRKPIYCSQHKQDGNVDVVHKKCLSKGCVKLPLYGVKGTKKRLYCVEHKHDDHVNVEYDKCLECDKVPVYGVSGTKKALYCKAHKHESHVDVKQRCCVYPDCKTRTSYGLLYEKTTHCAKHRTPNMYVKNKPKCEFENCSNRPFFTSRDDSYPERCDDHKHETDINLEQQKCSICLETMFIKSDTKMCNICGKIDIKQIRHEKELVIKKALETADIKFIHDKIPDDGCHRYRPDFLIDCGTHVIIVECDEFQHSSYNEDCEKIRMINIHQGFGGLKVMFVRFNPDGYTDHNLKKIKAGITSHRINRLISTVKGCIQHVPNDIISVIRLFYDEDNGQNTIDVIDIDAIFYPETIFIEV
ncbi:MAG: hypothetical protein PHG66_00420 [Candidatus Colwellbacteria bacterium]|nr:hypothetical protein [Candidatus Colwellbacteria bacterium]